MLGAYLVLCAVLRFINVRKLARESGVKMTGPMVLVAIEVLCGLFCISARVLLPDALFQAAGTALTIYGVLEILVILLTARARRIVKKA